ncbi:1,4-alpha-glucan branching protein GlgB [Nesterenkonia xinjiangensis]|uniref:1,4-alpha-glucan branching enzyme GlgB n=1 Tax=Nesterenkonia xinjiangensis TaxID=225327 RepID=A0A7Z0GK36_9MICC|nr:1,4-alpha-glucan branching protein GlgB [Nesterenkonia xinjiangensis]NYJ77459.1 1,4-alpha-glucan branching enzyme [Nesterenkonia xinjiangensis]
MAHQTDPHRHGPVLGALDEHLISEGTHHRLWDALGAHLMTHEGVDGVHFAVWAPNASRVAVVGDFNHWNAEAHPLRTVGSTGVWETFVPGVAEGAIYKYDLHDREGGHLPQKADPVGFGSEHPPATGSVVRRLDAHDWQDQEWLDRRAEANAVDSPISVYEVHLGSWRRAEGGRPLSYLELATELVDYVVDLGFTHIEVMPVSEHPFDGSWGYQPVGMYAPTIRHGTPREFAAFVDAAHARGIGVIADWVPGHFPTDAHGLARFDGTALYEHLDPRQGFHPDWKTLIYNYGRPEVRGYLVANALYWIDQYHLDGLRVDAVASMLYRDYSREEGEWIPNRDGGRENYEAIDFLRATNVAVYGAHDGVAMTAEESTSFPGVTRRVDFDGLGFGYKWNLGWMNDSLTYFSRDPVHRRYHHDDLTFGLSYAFSENFVLPISHDEVVHGKGSLYGRMPGSHADKLGGLKAFYGYMWGHPGKKLLFMGQEFGQTAEWNHSGELDWGSLHDPGHAGVQAVVRDLNRLYREQPALHRHDADGQGFSWLLVDAAEDQVLAWTRRGDAGDPHVVVVLNLAPVERTGYRIGFPVAGRWREALNTDSSAYGGGDRGHGGAVETEPVPTVQEAQSALLTLPPLSAIYFVEDHS